MSNPNAAAATPQKTPGYAWPCLIVSLLCAVSLVWAWQFMPGITVPVMKGWLQANCATFNPAGISNIMGLVPIGAMIMAFPASFLVQKIGPKYATCIGVALTIISCVICALSAASNFTLFLAGRFIMGLGLAGTIVAGPTCVSIWFPNTTRGRAMAIWSTWAPIGIFTINFFGGNLWSAMGESLVNLFWLFTVILVVVLVLFFFVFRNPKGDEVSEVSAERKKFKEVMPFFKSRQLWCLIAMFAIFNYMNYFFSNYLKTWLATDVAAGGMGWDPGMAGLIGGALCACGVLAPIGGWILDKLPRDKKFFAVVAGIASLTICSAASFLVDAPIFAVYCIFFCVGNMFLNGCCRPMVPTFVFKGGATAVSLGLAFLTFFQYVGQIPTTYVHAWGESMGWTLNETCLYCLVPVGVIGIILSLGMKPSKPKAGAAPAGAGKPAQ